MEAFEKTIHTLTLIVILIIFCYSGLLLLAEFLISLSPEGKQFDSGTFKTFCVFFISAIILFLKTLKK